MHPQHCTLTRHRCVTSAERMTYVAAFTASSFANVVLRTGKPFNPLLVGFVPRLSGTSAIQGETFELDRSYDLGWRGVVEQARLLPECHG